MQSSIWRCWPFSSMNAHICWNLLMWLIAVVLSGFGFVAILLATDEKLLIAITLSLWRTLSIMSSRQLCAFCCIIGLTTHVLHTFQNNKLYLTLPLDSPYWNTACSLAELLLSRAANYVLATIPAWLKCCHLVQYLSIMEWYTSRLPVWWNSVTNLISFSNLLSKTISSSATGTGDPGFSQSFSFSLIE